MEEKQIDEQKVELNDKVTNIDGLNIRYQVHGDGAIPLLLIHGAVGSLNDFFYQIKSNVSLDLNKFTIVALDLPGYGKSNQEERDFSHYAFEKDVRVCAQLMSQLGFKAYSVCGYDDGAKVAALLAIKYQSRVNALIIWGFTPMMDEETSKTIGKTRNVNDWDNEIKKLYSDVYGEQNFSHLWRKYVDYIMENLESPDQYDIRNQLHKLKCPTLICYGTNDPLVSYIKHIKPIETDIYDLEVVKFNGAAHNIHQSKAQEFNNILTDFVTNVGY